MKILMICKHNRFRSKVAEAIFNKLNKNKKIKAESAGTCLDLKRPYIEKIVIEIMKEKGYDIKGKPKNLTEKLIKKFDLIVIVADNVDVKSKMFRNLNRKMIIWKIKDADAEDTEDIKERIELIEKKVKKIIKSLNKINN